MGIGLYFNHNKESGIEFRNFILYFTLYSSPFYIYLLVIWRKDIFLESIRGTFFISLP